MALADLDAYLARVADPELVLPFLKVDRNITQACDGWLTGTDPGASPTTAVAPTSATTGSLGQIAVASNALRCLGASLNGEAGFYLLADRLSHQGGLVGNSSSTQTTNLPTAALTRFTSGVGVMAGISIYGQIGATATTVSVSYTNTTPTSGRTSPAMTIGAAAFRAAQSFHVLPLADSDDGVTSVESVTLAATTGTAGNFGVVLFKPLAGFVLPGRNAPLSYSMFDGLIGGLASIPNDACLFWVRWPGTGGAVGTAGSIALGYD